MSRSPSISIVIPCYRAQKGELHKLLKRLLSCFLVEEIIVVDVDGSVVLRTNRKIKLVRLKRNCGYAEALNIGTCEAKHELVLALNTDVRVNSKMLTQLAHFLEKTAAAGVVGPKILSTNRKISPTDLPVVNFSRFTGRIIQLIDTKLGSRTNAIEVAWISGCAFLFRKQAWRAVGGFDESYFMYWEDADFCLRVRNAGFKIYYLPRVNLVHFGSMSLGFSNPEKIYYIVRNALRFKLAHMNRCGQFMLWGGVALTLLVKSAKSILSINIEHNRMFLRGVVDFISGRSGRFTKPSHYEMLRV